MARTNEYILTLSKNYVSNWTPVNAIRELIQNALDSDSPFSYEWEEYEDGAHTLTLPSERALLTAKHLILGISDKTGDHTTIGKFGEGLKLALLVLCRDGIHISIQIDDKIWYPTFKWSAQYNTELLTIEEIPAEKPVSGVTVTISGLSDYQKEKVIESCLRMQKDLGETITTHMGKILKDRKGKLYCNSLYICDTSYEYSYDILPEFIELERDRQTVDYWELGKAVCKIWEATGRLDEIAEYIAQDLEDLRHMQYYSTQSIKDACYNLFVKAYPNGVVATSQAEVESLLRRKFSSVITVNPNYAGCIKGTTPYKEKLLANPEVLPPQPVDILQEWFDRNKKYMRTTAITSFKEILKSQAKSWKHL